MSTEQTFTAITIILTTVNVLITYFNLRHNKKKDFQDKLYQMKLQSYKELNASCYKSIKRLDINSSPFVQIYDYEKKEDWEQYCQQHMGEQFHESFELESLIYEHAMLLPTEIAVKYREFANHCISFVTMTYHFDTGLIIDKQNRLWDMYIDLLEEFRSDLNIEKIDESLRQRITSRV